PETGEIRRFRSPTGDRFDYASCSPWQDEEGQYQVVGRWSELSADGPSADVDEFGLARYTLPSGRVLDRVPLDVVPASPPCWFPGFTARVLYAASDGLLYRLSFEGDTPRRAGDPPPKPEPVEWRVNIPD